jgi:hypothetical protein
VISMRYHLISISAVLLALAVGVMLGSSTLSRDLLGGLNRENDGLTGQVADLEKQGESLSVRLAEADAFATAIGPLAVRGQLTGRTVALVATADADPDDRDALKALVAAAGATLTGEVELTEAFTDRRRADELKEIVTRLLPAGVQLPTVSDPGSLAGGLLGPLLLISKADNKPQASAQESAAAMTGLADGGFLQVAEGFAPAQLAIVLTGDVSSDEDAPDRSATIARFAAQVDRSGAGAVLTGPVGTAGGSGAIGLARADTSVAQVLSTVDNVDTPAGRIVTLLALREQLDERSGRYGVGGNAQALAPGLPGG